MDRFKLFDQRYSLARAKSGKYSKECCDIEKYWEKQYKFDVADDDRVVDDDLDDDGDNDGDYYDNDENTSDSEEEYIDDEYEVLCVCSESSDSNNSSCSTVNSTEQKDNEFDLLQFLLDDFFNNANTDNWGNEVYRDFRDHFDNKYFTVNSLRQILEKCPKFDINYIPYNQSSIFMETIKHHRLDLTRLLLDEFNVDVDAMHSRVSYSIVSLFLVVIVVLYTYQGTHTALHDCIIDGDHRAIRLLIEYGFDLTAIDKVIIIFPLHIFIRYPVDVPSGNNQFPIFSSRPVSLHCCTCLKLMISISIKIIRFLSQHHVPWKMITSMMKSLIMVNHLNI